MSEQQLNGAAVDGDGFLKTTAPVTEPGAQSSETSAPAFEPPKKRRGRPPGSGKLQAEGVPAGTASKAAKSAGKPRKTYAPSDYEAMGRQLVGVHQIGAMMTGIPEIAITDQEGIALAQAIGNVAEQYDLAIDGKTGAAIQLLMTAAMVYGPRALQVRARAANARKQSSDQNGAVVG